MGMVPLLMRTGRSEKKNPVTKKESRCRYQKAMPEAANCRVQVALAKQPFHDSLRESGVLLLSDCLCLFFPQLYDVKTA
jgi:hypothetical protein